METPRFAVVLSGCGVFDGSEIHEAVCALLAIDEAGCAYQCFAPNTWQAKTVDHLPAKPPPLPATPTTATFLRNLPASPAAIFWICPNLIPKILTQSSFPADSAPP